MERRATRLPFTRPAEDFDATRWVTEKRREGREGRGARKGSYLETKLSCLMLVSDVAWSVLKELREEEYGWMGWVMVARSRLRARRKRRRAAPRVLAYSRGLDVIRTHGRR